MRVWRLVGQPFAETAFDGEGAARYSGRWNSRGVRVVYTADSLALATLELAVHLLGARVGYTAIEVEIPDTSIDDVTNHYLQFSSLAVFGFVRNADPRLRDIRIVFADIAPLSAFLRSLNEDVE